jgi:FMN-dependent NADH-azoreductase
LLANKATPSRRNEERAMKLLHIDSSILGQNSASRELGAAWVANWQRENPQTQVRHVDLTRQPLAHLSAEIFAARAEPNAPRAVELQHDIDADQSALADFLAADVIVIGAPMYNFSIPSQLKAWIDRIVVRGSTFRYTPNGPEGLAHGKKAVIVISRGGIYSEGPAAAMDFQETYLRSVLGFVGITDIEVIRAEGLARGAEQRNEVMRSAHRAIAGELLEAA